MIPTGLKLAVGDSVTIVYTLVADWVLGIILTVGKSVPAFTILGFRLIVGGSVCICLLGFAVAAGDSVSIVFTFVAGWILGIMLTVGESVCIVPAFT
jgi:hypothetical protein